MKHISTLIYLVDNVDTSAFQQELIDENEFAEVLGWLDAGMKSPSAESLDKIYQFAGHLTK